MTFFGQPFTKGTGLFASLLLLFLPSCKKDLQEQLLDENQTTSTVSAATASLVTKVDAENYSTMYSINKRDADSSIS